MLPFIEAGKPVFAAEYTDMDVDFSAACNWGRQHNVSFILKNRILTAFSFTCPLFFLLCVFIYLKNNRGFWVFLGGYARQKHPTSPLY